MNATEDRHLHDLLHSAAQGAPSATGIAHEALTRGKRKVRRRRVAGVAGLAVAGLGVTALGVSGIGMTQDTKVIPAGPRAEVIPTRVDCASSNGGVVDYVGPSSGETPDVLADRWAAGSGFGERFPDTSKAVVHQNAHAVTVVYREPTGSVRAILHYKNSGDGWKIEGLEYC